jgi:c-di-GMP-binding flagellar brake protein YcgR
MEIETQTSSQPGERRRAPRVPFDEPILVRTSAGAAHRATGENLSELGMLLHANGDDLAAANQPLWVTFNLPEVPNLLQVQAEVVHTVKDGQLLSLGLRFMTVPAVIRRMLRTYVATGYGRIKDYDPATLN